MRNIFVTVIVLFALCFIPVNGQNLEYQVKANFLEKFTRFIDWPENSPCHDLNLPFVISVYGENPFGDILETMYSQGMIKNKKVIVRYIDHVEDINNSELLFVGDIDDQQLDSVIIATSRSPILTISEHKGFADKGIHINFYITDAGTIKFEINEKSMKQSGLRISHLLLQIAKIVDY